MGFAFFHAGSSSFPDRLMSPTIFAARISGFTLSAVSPALATSPGSMAGRMRMKNEMKISLRNVMVPGLEVGRMVAAVLNRFSILLRFLPRICCKAEALDLYSHEYPMAEPGNSSQANPAERGMRSTLIGISVNILLVVVKGAAGLLGNSYALIADAVESATDIASSLIIWISLKISVVPPDAD